MSSPQSTSTDLLVAGGRHLKLSPARLAEIDRQIGCTVAAAERARSPITCLGPTIVSPRPRLYAGPRTDWVLTPLEHDPLHRNGRFPIPREARRHLTRLNRAPIHFDDVLVAHEIPKDLAPSHLPVPVAEAPVDLAPTDLEDLILHPGAAHTTRAASERAGALAGSLAGSLGRFAAGTARAAVMSAGGVAAVLLDPVIFGIQRLPDQADAGIVYELVRWDW